MKPIWAMPLSFAQGSLFRKYAGMFAAVLGLALFVNGLANIWSIREENRLYLDRLQSEQASAAAGRISQFIKSIEPQLGWTTHFSWSGSGIEQRRLDGQRLMRQVPAIRRGIAYVPITPFEPPASAVSALDDRVAIAERRARLGVPENAFVVGRLARSDPSKWDSSNFDLVNSLLERVPQAAWLSIGYPEKLGRSTLQQRWGHRFVDHPETSDYARLMAHLDRTLPGSVHRVIHEALVADTEAEVRALLDHCGLDFEPACLAFHETERAVRTASSEQVRQPIFTGGSDAWRPFAAHLAQLRAALSEDLIAAYPSAPETVA